MGDPNYQRKYPSLEELKPEFDRLLQDYTDEINFIHARYLADFAMEYPAKYPLFNKIKIRMERTRKVTFLFGRRHDFELFHTTRQGNNGTVWRRIQSKEQDMASATAGGE